MKQVKDFKIYFITIIVSLLLLLPSLFCKATPLLSILSGMGCSGIAAAVMAIFLDMANTRRESQRQQRTKTLYFKHIYDQLIMMMGRILWFSERLSDESFNWELDDNVYSTMNYMVAVSTKYPNESISYKDAVERLSVIGEKYNLDNIKSISENEKHKILRMFQIIAAGSTYLIIEANNIKANKLILEAEDYFSVEDNDQLMFDISLALGLMGKPDKNNKAIIGSLIRATDKIRELGHYTNNVDVRLHGSISVNEL